MTPPLITAAEARALDPALRVEADLAALDALIRKRAAAGERSLRVPYELTETKGDSVSFKTPGVTEALKAAGYAVNHRYEARQFVDVWIEISWEARP